MNPISASSAEKKVSGMPCKVLKQTKSHQGRFFTCVKSGSKLIWNKGIPNQKPNSQKSSAAIQPDITADSYEFLSICEADPFVPPEWKQFQEAEIKFNGCPPPYRYLKKELTTEIPQMLQTSNSELSPIRECKLTSSRVWTGTGPLGSLKEKSTVIQIVPFYMSDKSPSRTPIEDWAKYLDFAIKSIKLMADTELNIEIRLPDRYLRVEGDLAKYNLGYSVEASNQTFSDNRWNLINDVIPVADKTIDFSHVDAIWFLTSSEVPRSIFSHQIAHSRSLITKEKQFSVHNSYFMSIPPSDFIANGLQAREPFGFVHELMHIFNTLDDHRDGGGNWGNMSGARMDFLTWDKWTMSWIADSQVRCAPKNETSTHWIKPSTIRGNHEKLVLIPLSSRRAIAIESIRSYGFNLKLPKTMNGVLIYTVNANLLDDGSSYEDGIEVVCPTNRDCAGSTSVKNFALAGATFKPGESVTVEGYKITIVESGEFGDVVRIDAV